MVSDISYTVFADVMAQHATPHTTSWDALCQSLTDAPQFASKQQCPLLKLCTFGATRTGKGSLRHDANVVSVAGLVGDYDAEVLGVVDAAARLEAYGIEAFFYTSASHTVERPRWRVLLPLSVEHAPADYGQLMAVANEMLGGVLAAESFTLSQSFYFGRVTGVTYETRRVAGVVCIDEIAAGFAGVIPAGRKGAASHAAETNWVLDAKRSGSFYGRVNNLAIAKLGLWVPNLFPAARESSGGYRVSQSDLGRPHLEEDLTIMPDGIVDFGVYDMGDPKHGRRTSCDLVMEWLPAPSAKDAAFWLCERLGVATDEMGWEPAGAVDRQIQVVSADKYASLDEHQMAFNAAGTLRELDEAVERARIDPRLTDDTRETLAHHYQRALEHAGSPKLPIAMCRVKLAKPKAVAVVDDFDRDHEGVIERTQKNLNTAMRKLGFRYDTFTGRLYFGNTLANDNTYTSALVAAEMMGCQTPSIQQVRLAVNLVAEENQFDSALDWAATLTWDGVPRIETCLHRVFNMEPAPYIRAVSRYLWTALAGRLVSKDGVKADAIPVLVSEEEGFSKTTLVEAFAPFPDFFGELDMNTKKEDTQRLMRGKLVLEWNELTGLKTREMGHILSFITRKIEAFVDKFQTVETKYSRRCMIIATANDTYFMDAHTTGRRFLPIELSASRADVVLLRSEINQLWAEAIATFHANGVEWQALETVAPVERDKFREDDPLYLHIESFLNSPRPFRYGETSPINYGDEEIRIAQIKAYLERNRLVRKLPSDVAISKLLRKKFGYTLHRKANYNVWIKL